MAETLVDKKIAEAKYLLIKLGVTEPRERDALVFLALCSIKPGDSWKEAKSNPLRIHDILAFINRYYGKHYKENTRETIRKTTLYRVLAHLIQINEDNPSRPVNSPHTNYRIREDVLLEIAEWDGTHRKIVLGPRRLRQHSEHPTNHQSLLSNGFEIEIQTPSGLQKISLSHGGQNLLIKEIIQHFVPRFVPQGKILYIGDARNKTAFIEKKALEVLGVSWSEKGPMPDLIIFDENRRWLVIIEAVYSSGAIDRFRFEQLSLLVRDVEEKVIFITAFKNRAVLRQFVTQIAWKTDVWLSAEPDHLIHFDGDKFLPH